tara:strand:+ start:338 stop:1828 length:1491 start_codon:yes stop_codon:yes gene_type:complete
MGSINGLKNIQATSIQNAGQFYLGNNLDSGTAGQVIISAGPQEAAIWGSNSATLPGALTMGTNLSLASGNASFDGTTADTINAAGLSITGGNGISVAGGTEIITDNDGTTINNSGGTGQQNQVLKVPNALTAGTGIGFSAGTTYDGSAAITINSTATDTTYQGSSTINIDTSTNPDTINALKVPNVMTASSNIIFNNTDDGASASTYDGSQPITIRATDTNTTYQGSSTINIDTSTNPDTINALKVPNVMTASSNIIFNNTDDGASATTYDGSQPISIRAVDTNTEYTAGTNLNNGGTTFNLDTSITGQTGITFLNNGASTNLTGSNYPNKPTIATNLDLTSSTNIFPHPAGVFDVGGKLRMSINLSNFLPNDDSSYYNLAVEDDFVAATMGTIKPMTSSLEVCGYFIIPEGYTATGARIDLNNSSGTPVSRLTQAYRITTYGGTGYLSLHSWTTGAEATFGTSMVAASDTIMLIKIFTASTADHIRGGYILLTRN